MALLGIVNSRSSVFQSRGNIGNLEGIVSDERVSKVNRGSIGTPVGMVSKSLLVLTSAVVEPVGSTVKVRLGGVWMNKPVKVRLGLSWVAKPVKVWLGGSWVVQ